tara:strand:+ start:7533 stop:9341 length:1809 start_codon:yes stop_codon:yes gene_type:complete
MKYLIAFFITFSFLFTWEKSFGAEINTGNILTNPGFTGGTSSWTNHGSTQQHHVGMGNECPGSAVDNSNSGCGVSGSLATLDNGGVSQTIKLSETTNMTQSEINHGFSSTMSTDIWYWHGQDTVTMKQELTDSAGNTTTQTRIVVGNHNNFQTYTDKVTVGTNTSTDYDIKVQLDIDDSANCSSHCGPDIDNVELNITYTYINPIEEDIIEIIDDISDTIPPPQDDWFDDEWEYVEDDWSWEDEYVIIEDDTYFDDFEDTEFDIGEGDYFEDNFYFEEELDFEVTEFEIEEFEEPEFEFFEETDFDIAPPDDFFEEDYGDIEIMEEIFEEEFEEEFTAFLEDSGMAEEFEAFLEEEGMTEQEFFEEITEEEFNDEFTEESFEEINEPMEEVEANEDSVSEITETEAEAMEPEQMEEPASETKQENDVAQNDTEPEEPQQDEQKEEPDSTGSEDSEVQSEEDGEQEVVQQEGRKVDSEGRIATNVAKIDSKISKNLKNVAKQIAKIVKQNTKNLTKEELFFKNNNGLSAYTKQDFYKSKDIYGGNTGLFDTQIDLGAYSIAIYVNASLNEYIGNDPIQKRIKKLDLLAGQKAAIMLELKLLKK